MIKANSLQTKAIIQFSNKTISYRLERRDGTGGEWQALTESGFIPDGGGVTPLAVRDIYLDEYAMNGICQYRARDIASDSAPWDYTPWLRRGTSEQIGYMYGNYKAPEGSWGEILTTDDLRGYLWGIDFRASNGESYTDAQIKFFIDAALEEVERLLNITIKKVRVVTEPERKSKRR